MNIAPIPYLSGPIAGCTDEEMHGWRYYLKGKYPAIHFIDPTIRDYRGFDDNGPMPDKIRDKIVEIDLFELRTLANCLICNYRPDKRCVGSIMEVKDAFDFGKLVIVNVPEGHHPSPWLRYHSNKITTSLDQAIEEILERFH